MIVIDRVMGACARNHTLSVLCACAWRVGIRSLVACLLAFGLSVSVRADPLETGFAEKHRAVFRAHCFDCHNTETREGDFDLTSLSLQLDDPSIRNRWIHVYDRIEKREMPPTPEDLNDVHRQSLLQLLGDAITRADRKDVNANGRGPLRRLTREEYEQNLRDVLKLPLLDIRDMLPEDREEHGFNKTARVLDMSRVQLTACLNAADAALRAAMVTSSKPPPVTKYRAVATQLFSSTTTFGQRQAMFFAYQNKAVGNDDLEKLKNNPELELALFRSAHWPYFGYPRDFVAKRSGVYRVRFSARAVLQTEGFRLTPATAPVPMTFRARKPSGPDVSGDVRATGGIMDIQPEAQVFETTIRLLPHETFEYSLLGLPVPLARNVDGGPPTYRYPPFPKGGQPGVAFQWLEVEGPIQAGSWPPASHAVLFDDLGLDVTSANPEQDARRLLRRFVKLAARQPVGEEAIRPYEQLVLTRLQQEIPFREALLAGYKAFLCSSEFLYLREPVCSEELQPDQYAIASRLSHFLTNTRPDHALLQLAAKSRLTTRDNIRNETDRLIASPGFERFVTQFTDYWLNLRHIRRDEPDIRLFPEYRFDDYLIESMRRETRRFFIAMIRDNLPSSVLVDADFVYVNDRLAEHYRLPQQKGSDLRRVRLSGESPYGGLLTQAAVLKVTSNGTATSPVIRGAWIMDRLLGQPPPPPPKSVPAVEPDIRGARTIRELLKLHTTDSTCASCHARFDSVGLALENFDIFGRWRDHYRAITDKDEPVPATETPSLVVKGIDRAGHDYAYAPGDRIDASGQLADGTPFHDIHQLKKILASEHRQLARNLLQQFTVYSTGTPVRFSDRDDIESILDQCANRGYRIRDLIHGLVQNRIFLGKELAE